MALGITIVDYASIGNRYQTRFKLAFDSSYPTGGESLTPTQLKMNVVQFLWAMATEGGFLFGYDYANQKIQVFGVGGGTPVTLTMSNWWLTVAAVTPKTTVVHQAVPVVQPALITFDDHGRPVVNSANIAVGTDDIMNLPYTFLVPQHAEHLMIRIGVVGLQLYCRQSTNEFVMNNTFSSESLWLPTSNGSVFEIIHDPLAPVGGDDAAVQYNDGVGLKRFEATFADASDHTVSVNRTHIDIAPTPSGSVTGAGAIAEIPNATDLSALTAVECLAIGQ